MRHYAFSDIHGQGKLFDAMVEYMRTADTDDWRCYYLGDACDRGKDGYRIITFLLQDPHFIYLKGNHEDMFAKAANALHYMAEQEQLSISEFIEHNSSLDIEDLAYEDDNIELYFYNGGLPTFKSWIANGAPLDIIHRLEDLPISTTYDNYDMCHAGCLVRQWDAQNEQTFLWNRGHFLTDEEWRSGRILLHGHTPVRHLLEFHNPDGIRDEPLVYANGTKIDLDVGVVVTGTSCLCDLDNHLFIPFRK